MKLITNGFKFPTSKNLASLRSNHDEFRFLSMINYYKDFLENEIVILKKNMCEETIEFTISFIKFYFSWLKIDLQTEMFDTGNNLAAELVFMLQNIIESNDLTYKTLISIMAMQERLNNIISTTKLNTIYLNEVVNE